MLELDLEAKEAFIAAIDVSRETILQLDRYAELLHEWNAKFNLIGESTFKQIWRRHFLDSAQLIKHMPPSGTTLADLGSGAGFPGIVLSILGVSRTHLIESTGKKANFLRLVASELKLDVTVHQTRIESIQNQQFDVITARALKPLVETLKYSKPLMHKHSVCLFLKGQQVQAELTEAGKYWKFDCDTFPSLSDSSGRVLRIRNLK